MIMEKIKESEMMDRMKSRINEIGHDEFVELYQAWFPLTPDINWDVSGPE